MSEKKPFEKIRDYTILIPIAILLLTLIGLYSVSGWYEHFNITIFTYLEPTEILFLFASDLKAILFAALFLSVGPIMANYLFAENVAKFFNRKNLNFLEFLQKRKNPSKGWTETEAKKIVREGEYLMRKSRRFIFWVIFFMTVVLLVVSARGIYLWIPFFNGNIIAPFTFGFYFIYFTNLALWGMYFIMMFKNLTRFFLLIEILLVFIFFDLKNYVAYKNIVIEPKYSITLETGSETITTNDSIVFIGRTKNYYFFTNKNNNQNRIVPQSIVTNELQMLLRGGL